MMVVVVRYGGGGMVPYHICLVEGSARNPIRRELTSKIFAIVLGRRCLHLVQQAGRREERSQVRLVYS